MNFWEAIQAMDDGKTVRMCVNPERYYRLAKDGCTFVNRPIHGDWAYEGKEFGGEWRSAFFTTTHVRGEWQIVEGVR